MSTSDVADVRTGRDNPAGAIAAVVALLLVAGVIVAKLVNSLVQFRDQSLRVTRVPEGIVVRAPLDGPYIVTHIFALSDGETRAATAPLTEPVALTEAGASMTITVEEMRKLRWRDYMTNKPAPFPATARRFRVFYTMPRWVEPSPAP